VTAPIALLSAKGFGQQGRTSYAASGGLPCDDVQCVVAGPGARVCATCLDCGGHLADGAASLLPDHIDICHGFIER
jgi:hypothetical protein